MHVTILEMLMHKECSQIRTEKHTNKIGHFLVLAIITSCVCKFVNYAALMTGEAKKYPPHN